MKLYITNGTVLLDDEDVELVSQYNWHVNDKGYAVWRGIKDGKKQTIRMHRLIMNTPDGMDTDHINHNRLDNRRANLRICDRKTNLNNGSKVLDAKGYYYEKQRGKWRPNKYPSPLFNTEEEVMEYVKRV